ncbi:nuclear pore complex protein Nup205 isoform X2 [Hydra vulgaris]|uniref:Nuclear pore complex protein Nup205 isoform X2 n=1 Tax=Hydra vulgaris TaxID=6087 RepID=A0ABM4D6D7_HYDVU
MWSSKEILHICESAIVYKQSEIYAELDEVLTKYKPIFLTLLKDQEKDSCHREKLKKANKEGIQIDSHVSLIKLQEAMIQDAFLLSDGLQLNEFTCVELLLAGEQQASNFPGMSTNLVAALLYHDGRKSLLSALKLLLTARPGVTWTLELDDRIVELIDKFTSQIIENGLVTKLLQLLQDISLPNELKKLESARALSDGKHKKQIIELIEEQQLLLGDCLFIVAKQNTLPVDDCVSLLNYLKIAKPNTPDGSLDFVTARVLLALLSSFNCDIMDLAVENIGNEQYEDLPYFKDKLFFQSFNQTLCRPDIQYWQTPGIKSTIILCWAIFLRACSAHPHFASFADIFEEDEVLLDLGIEGDGFNFIRKSIIQSRNFHEEEYFLKTVHSFVTSFIVKFPLKIKDIRNHGDENARIIQAHLYEGIEPPQGLRHDFKDFMLLVSALYSKDPLQLELCCEYWIPPEPLGGMFSPKPLKKNLQAIDERKLMLNKFVQHAGDVLLQPLYIPYIDMLTSLSNNEEAASYCFRLLTSSRSTERSSFCIVSWDHFFLSLKQYYLSLRQVIEASDHRVHLHRHQEISPDELAGLESIIKLIKIVAEKNENVRIAFCENQTWLPVASLLGLVCCPIPANLKGLLLETLAAFSKTPEIAASIWQSLEASQVLQTNTCTQKSGIAVEIQEIESRNETYPETRGFMKLLDQLTNITIPQTLGAGHRTPGFDPYLVFLVDSVFLKFKTRAYKDLNEKWDICSEVLQLFVKILQDYDPLPEHFQDTHVLIQGVNFGKASKPPGYQLLSSLLNYSPMLRMVFSVIDDVLELLKTVSSSSCLKGVLESAVGSCLLLLESVFEKQALFTDLVRQNGSSLLLSSLDDLLLSVNPRTGAPDYLLIIARFLTTNNLKTSVVLSAIRILKYACDGLRVQKEIVSIFSKDELGARELLVGFSEQLEIDDPEVVDELKDENTNIQDLIRQEVIQLLISTIKQPSHNLAQFLLGFEIHIPVSKTNLQDAGVKGFPKTCFHAIITILNKTTSMSYTPKFKELLYHILYLMCSHQEMGLPTRRYLRTSLNFFVRHSSVLPFLKNEIDVDQIKFIRLANQQSWLLKALAIEIKVIAASHARSSLQQLIAVLFNDSCSNDCTSASASNYANYPDITQNDTGQSFMGPSFKLNAESKSLILSLLSSLSFVQDYPPNISLNFFDYSAVEQLFINCEETDEVTSLCNVKKLYKVLMAEINNSQITTGQRYELLNEVKLVIKHAVDRNLVRESFLAKTNSFDAWRQVVEVIFAVCPDDILSLNDKQTILVTLLKELFLQLNNTEHLPELTSPITGTILSLMANLWLLFAQFERVSSKNYPFMSSISGLLPSIISAITSAKQARMRANLYGAFLYYVQIGNMQNSVAAGVVEDIFSKQSKEGWETVAAKELVKYGDMFFEVVAKDTCQGSCISRMMSMSVLDVVASLDWQRRYLSIMSSRGYLRALVDQLQEDDVDLLNILSLQPDSMKPLYMFQSKMTLLAKIGLTDVGAQSLIQVGVLSRLSECQFLDYHIDKLTMMATSSLAYSNNQDPFLPTLIERYSSIFIAVSQLLLAFLSSLGVRHRIATKQIQNLIINHEEAFLNILHHGCENISKKSCQLLSMVISIMSLLVLNENSDDSWEILGDEQRHWRMFMNRVQRLMFVMLRKFSYTHFSKQVEMVLEVDREGAFSPINVNHVEVQNTLLQIRSRIFTFFKNIVASKGLSGPYSRIIFSPSLTDTHLLETRFSSGKSVNYKQLPSLHLLLTELKGCPEQLKQCVEANNILKRKVNSVSDMTNDEINEILSQEPDTDRLPFHQRKAVVYQILEKLLMLREEQASYLTYILEHVVYILWRHLDYFYIHCIPNDDFFLDDANFLKSNYSSHARKLTEGSFSSTVLSDLSKVDQTKDSINTELKIKKEDLLELKCEASKLLNEQLWSKVLDFDQLQGRPHSFLSALVRRIQSLIQLNM